MRISRRALTGLAAGLLLPAPALANRRNAVDLLVPGPAGGTPDRMARALAPFLERAWPRQALMLRNCPGRGGLEVVSELADRRRARPAIAMLTTPLLLARAVEAGEDSPLSRMAPLAALIEEPVVLVTAPGRTTDLDKLRAGAPDSSIGTPPAGTGGHVAGMRLAERAGLPLLPFPSAAAARQAAAAGHVAASALTLPDAIGFLRENKLVALGVALPERIPLLPELPTLREAGLEVLGATRRGFALAKDAPENWRNWLRAGLESLAADPDLAAQCGEVGQVPRFLGPEAWGSLLIRQEEQLRRRWRDEPWLPRRA